MCTYILTFCILCLVFINLAKCDDIYAWRNLGKTGSSILEAKKDSGYKVGLPLTLTPYIKQGNIKAGRKKALVSPQMGSWPSYSGYFTVNEECGNNLFFWFVQAKNNWKSAPVLLWLQGGPGVGSLVGLFEEIGPYIHFPSGLKERELTWNTDNNVIYIDQPVGSGYSYSLRHCFAVNQTTATEELYSALVQFFKLFPELQKNDFFLTGESFAGHYLPAIGLHIHQNNPTAKIKINLKGILMGNPLNDLSCTDYATFLYNWGAIGEDLRDDMTQQQEKIKKHSKLGRYGQALDDWIYILYNQIADIAHIYSYECMIDFPMDQTDYVSWITTEAVRRQIHVGNVDYNRFNWNVFKSLGNTFAQPTYLEVEQLLEANQYSVGFVSGNLDMICLTTSTECFLGGLQWSGSQDYQDAERKPFTVDGWASLAGWVKTAGPLYLVVVKDSGHSIPIYKPNVTLTLINKVTTAAPGVNPGTLLDF